MSATGKRRKSRELAMQMLFQGDIGKQTPEQVQKSFWEARSESELDPETRGFAEDIYRVASVREAEIDALIVQHSANWRLTRMPAVRTAMYCVRRSRRCSLSLLLQRRSLSTSRWRWRGATPRLSRSISLTESLTLSPSRGRRLASRILK